MPEQTFTPYPLAPKTAVDRLEQMKRHVDRLFDWLIATLKDRADRQLSLTHMTESRDKWRRTCLTLAFVAVFLSVMVVDMSQRLGSQPEPTPEVVVAEEPEPSQIYVESNPSSIPQDCIIDPERADCLYLWTMSPEELERELRKRYMYSQDILFYEID